MATANHTRTRNLNVGLIVTLVLALVGGTWRVATAYGEFEREFEMLRNDVDSLRSGLDAIQTDLHKLRVATPQYESKVGTQAEVATRAGAEGRPLAQGLEHFCDAPAATRDPDVPIIAIGQTVNGELSEADERLDDDTYVDYWLFPVCEAGQVTVEMKSDTLDSFVFLISLATLDIVQVDDDSGDGLDARLTADVSPGVLCHKRQ